MKDPMGRVPGDLGYVADRFYREVPEVAAVSDADADRVMSAGRINHVTISIPAYPNDIIAAAVDAVGVPDKLGYAKVLTEVVAEAIFRERERCAKIADDYELVESDMWSLGSEMNAYQDGQEWAANAIRDRILQVSE